MSELTGKDFYDMSGPDLLAYCGADASKWAEAFCRIKEAQGWGAADIDEGLMIGWFANAIEHSLQVRATTTVAQQPGHGGDLYRYVPDIVKNAMLTMWNYICDETKCHPLDIEHGEGKYLTFEPKHWAQFTGEMVERNIRDLFDGPAPQVTEGMRGQDAPNGAARIAARDKLIEVLETQLAAAVDLARAGAVCIDRLDRMCRGESIVDMDACNNAYRMAVNVFEAATLPSTERAK